MDWLSQNWTWLLFIGAMVAMHLFGHRGHGGHGPQGGRGNISVGQGGCGGGHAHSGKTATEERPHPEAGHEEHA